LCALTTQASTVSAEEGKKEMKSQGRSAIRPAGLHFALCHLTGKWGNNGE